MPYSDNDALKIFISYALEDQTIADALARQLNAAFDREIEITMMSEFQTGEKWRELILKSIFDTDIFIPIETGQLKRSHSFTGAEVGMFTAYLNISPKMKKHPDMARLMIPFAVLTSSTDTTNEFEGIIIDFDNLSDVRFDPIHISQDLKNAADAKVSRVTNLFTTIENLISTARNEVRTIDQATKRASALREIAANLTQNIIEQMLNRKKCIEYPKAKIVIRLPPTEISGSDPLSQAIIRIEGECKDVFGQTSTGTTINWGDLTKDIEPDIAFQWGKAIRLMVSSSKESASIDDNSIISFDRKRIYRVFPSEIVVYYSNFTETHIYIVEILREKDRGDAETTLLLHAAEIGLGYRFMFLEKQSEFSPSIFTATKLEDMKYRTSEMIDALTWLLVKAENYKLNDPANILRIMGIESAQDIEYNYTKWDEAKSILYKGAMCLLTKDSVDQEAKKNIISIIKNFVKNTQKMNLSYTTAVLNNLEKKIFNTSLESSEDQILSGTNDASAKKALGQRTSVRDAPLT